MLLSVLSLQIWVNTNATRSVSVCTTLWGRVPAVHHRKCLLEKRVCFVPHCAACVLLTFNLYFLHVKQVIWDITKGIVLLFTLCSILVPTSPPQNVVVQSSTATQLDVTWDPPPLDAQNGDIQGYKVWIVCLFFLCYCKSGKPTSWLSFFKYFHWNILNSFILFIDLFLGVSAPEWDGAPAYSVPARARGEA